MKRGWYSSLACQVLLGYIILWAISVTLLSDTFLIFLGWDAAYVAEFRPFKRWIFLGITAPILYMIVAALSNNLKDKNSQLEAAQNKVMRLNRVHRIMSEVEHIILRAHDRKILLRDICNMIKQKGNYAFVWVGLGEVEGVLPKLIITSNDENNYLLDLFDGLQINAEEENNEPSLLCFHKKYHVVENDINGDTKKRFTWQLRALENNFQSIAAFPLKTTSGWAGVFAIYASEPNLFSDEEVKLLGEMASDISYGLSDIEQKEKLYYAANYDVITNLPNPQLLEDRLDQTIARASHDNRAVGLACVELIELDEIIYTYSQDAGDKVLRETAKHFNQMIRDGDTIARLGENTLGVMLADVADVYDIPMVIQKIIRPFLVQLTNYKEIPIKMRAGVSIYPKDADSGLMLIKNAELALKGISTHDNLDCAYFCKDITTGLKYTKTIETELEMALEKNEFKLYFQPVVDMRSNHITYIEALLRWDNSKLGELTAIQFIHIAENKLLIQAIDEWVIHEACVQLMAWKKKGINYPLTINISMHTFLEPTFIQKMRSIFNAVNFEPGEFMFGIEIPETLFASNTSGVIEILEALKKMKINTYIDDFGIGYASLGYLHGLPINAFKIDPILVRNSESEKTIRTTIKGIIAFAKGINVETIAEGVETEKQKNLMLELGCHYAQGYMFSAPISAEAIERLLH